MAGFLEKIAKIHSALLKAALFVIIGYNGLIARVSAQEVTNPLGDDVTSFADVLENIADEVTTIAPYIAVVFVIVAGLQFLFAGESEEKIRKAKQTLWWTLIGTAILVGASLLTDAVINTVRDL
ncbi:MAG: TrbC/VirB2 family protein [bacterium]|nr:TrbC/VirB2 family protein [bacterium]